MARLYGIYTQKYDLPVGRQWTEDPRSKRKLSRAGYLTDVVVCTEKVSVLCC